MKYKRIRGPNQALRCTDPIKGRLYCACGCQEPQTDDPQPDISNLIVVGRASHGYADYKINHRSTGASAGEINTQYCALVIEGYEYLGCDREEMSPLFDHIFDGEKNRFALPLSGAGDTLAETAAVVHMVDRLVDMDQNDRNKHHVGWCEKCGSFCYGDCEANY